MTRWLSLALTLLLTVNGYAQRERVFLALDIYACGAGDTIWFKGVIFKGLYPTTTSTTVYLQLYNESGALLQQDRFPVFQGQAIGQIILPDSLLSNNYYIVALTRQQLNYDSLDFFSVPVRVYHKDKLARINRKKKSPGPDLVAVGSIRGITWITALYDGKLTSLLALDSRSMPRRLHLVYPTGRDSLLRADVELSDRRPQKYTLLPLDSGQTQAVVLLYEDSLLIGRQFLRLGDDPGRATLHAETLDTTAFGYNSWQVKIPDSMVYFTSIAVTDADRSPAPPVTIESLQDPYTDNFVLPETRVDASYITYQGKATRESGKRIKDPFSQQLFIAAVRDSNFVFAKLADLDAAGKFTLDSLFFFGDLDCQFQINKEWDGHTKDVKLTLEKFTPPTLDSTFFSMNWQEDSTASDPPDSLYTQKELTQYELSKMKMLRPAVVKARRNSRKELDDRYATGIFSEPALYSFDLRLDKTVNSIWMYLRKNLPGFSGGSDIGLSPTFNDKSVTFFVDNQLQSAEGVDFYWYQEIAYIKVFPSLWVDQTGPAGFTLTGGGAFKIPIQSDPPVICIYTRKGRDIRTGWKGLNQIKISGYSPIARWTGLDENRWTLYWQPLQTGNDFRIKFYNNQTARHFRLTIQGFNRAGRLLHVEKILPAN